MVNPNPILPESNLIFWSDPNIYMIGSGRVGSGRKLELHSDQRLTNSNNPNPTRTQPESDFVLP